MHPGAQSLPFEGTHAPSSFPTGTLRRLAQDSVEAPGSGIRFLRDILIKINYARRRDEVL